jgi:GxxExxY protein
MKKLRHEDLSRDIIAAAMKVRSTLRPGLNEKLDENALLLELAKRGHRVDQQRDFPVHYDGPFIGKLTPDLLVDDLVIVDPKVVEQFNEAHVSQMLGSLAITGLELALLRNFKRTKLQWKRVVKPRGDSAAALA